MLGEGGGGRCGGPVAVVKADEEAGGDDHGDAHQVAAQRRVVGPPAHRAHQVEGGRRAHAVHRRRQVPALRGTPRWARGVVGSGRNALGIQEAHRHEAMVQVLVAEQKVSNKQGHEDEEADEVRPDVSSLIVAIK